MTDLRRGRCVALMAWLIVTVAMAGGILPGRADAAERVVFLATSDCHYDAMENEDRNERNRDTVRHMNEVSSLSWPEQLGGGPIDRPRGVVVLGDIIDDGDRKFQDKPQSRPQWEAFVRDFGLSGTDGLLKYRVLEGWGNHDGPPEGREKFGFSMQGELKRRNQLRRAQGWLTGLSANSLHYSWDWSGVHLVQLGIYPADRQHPQIKYSPQWHDPQGALSFLKQDLAAHVGTSGRPVVLMSHCGFDTNWWHAEDWAAVYQAVKPYHVLLYLYGHTATGVGQWKPEGESKPLATINTGQTEKGFFVVEISGSGVKAAYRCKRMKSQKKPDGKTTHSWDGQWEWRHVMNRPG